MALESISIRNLRNLVEIHLRPQQGINLIVGTNGSGKTSLLEAIYILGRGRSFRESKSRAVIMKGKPWYEVTGQLEDNGISTRIGIRRSAREITVRMNGTSVRKLSTLAKQLPIHIITPRSHELLEAGAGVRRRFIEWGVFHVEHGYQRLSSRYHRALTQRNAALKNQQDIHALWDEEIIELAGSIDRIRRGYVEELSRYLEEEMQHLLDGQQVRLEWRRGWDAEQDLGESLDRNRSADLSRGFTHAGPHRADLVVRLEGELSRQWASRGQQKLIVCGLFLAQTRLIRERTGKRPVILMDDLAAELDREHRERMLDRLRVNDSQVFITATDAGIFSNRVSDAMFHVEHGAMVPDGV